jgi:diaminopimelate epimerase
VRLMRFKLQGGDMIVTVVIVVRCGNPHFIGVTDDSDNPDNIKWDITKWGCRGT